MAINSRASLDRSPGKKNWVENSGGLPMYIRRIANHLHQEKGMTIGHAIAVAVNAVKKMCGTGDLNWKGKQNVNAKSRAEACAAVASWEKKKASARVSKGIRGRKLTDEEYIDHIISISKACCKACEEKDKKRKKKMGISKASNPFWDGDGLQGVGQPRDHLGRWVGLPGKSALKKVGVWELEDGSFGLFQDGKQTPVKTFKSKRVALKNAAKAVELDKPTSSKSATRKPKTNNKKRKRRATVYDSPDGSSWSDVGVKSLGVSQKKAYMKLTPEEKEVYSFLRSPGGNVHSSAMEIVLESHNVPVEGNEYHEPGNDFNSLLKASRKYLPQKETDSDFWLKVVRSMSDEDINYSIRELNSRRRSLQQFRIPNINDGELGKLNKKIAMLKNERASRKLKKSFAEISDEEFDLLEDEVSNFSDAADDTEDFIISGEIEKREDDKQLVFGWCSIAKRADGTVVVDKQGDVLEDIDQMEKVAYDFVLHSRDGGEMHVRKGVSTLVESFVSTPDKIEKMGIPEGILPTGWWVGFKVNDSAVWEKVKKGEYKMFSVHGTGRRRPIIAKDDE